jgi:hypothetical protein
MEATVNMKMTPAEHRLIREAVQNKADVLRANMQAGAFEPREREQARETEAKLRLLLERL